MSTKPSTKSDRGAVKEVYVSLRILGDLVDPGLITSKLALIPTKAYFKGQEYASKGGTTLKHPTGNWTLTSKELTDSQSVEDHAIALLEKLTGKSTIIETFKHEKEVCVSITIWWRPKDGHGTFCLSSDTMRRLSVYADETMFYIS